MSLRTPEEVSCYHLSPGIVSVGDENTGWKTPILDYT